MAWVFGTAIHREGDDFVVNVRDLPEVVTSGDDEVGALELAADAIEVSIAYRMKKGEALPVCTPVLDGEHAVAMPSRVAAKASIYEAWRSAGITKVELGQRMNRSEVEARRILDMNHGTKLDQLDEAARALGLQFTIGLAPITTTEV